MSAAFLHWCVVLCWVRYLSIFVTLGTGVMEVVFSDNFRTGESAASWMMTTVNACWTWSCAYRYFTVSSLLMWPHDVLLATALGTCIPFAWWVFWGLHACNQRCISCSLVSRMQFPKQLALINAIYTQIAKDCFLCKDCTGAKKFTAVVGLWEDSCRNNWWNCKV